MTTTAASLTTVNVSSEDNDFGLHTWSSSHKTNRAMLNKLADEFGCTVHARHPVTDEVVMTAKTAIRK